MWDLRKRPNPGCFSLGAAELGKQTLEHSTSVTNDVETGSSLVIRAPYFICPLVDCALVENVIKGMESYLVTALSYP